MKIATLGPEGTFSQQAVLKIEKNAEIIYTKSIRDVFDEVEKGNVNRGVVPVENSLGGAVSFTQDALLEFDLSVEAEEIIPIIHFLMSKEPVELTNLKKLYLHPQAYAQCEEFIHKNMPNVEIIETSSNADSAKKTKEDSEVSACIGPELSADIYGLTVLKKSVQDKRFNVTRFFVISKNQNPPTGYDKTSITVYPQVDRPGLLYEILSVFKEHNINLTKIESRPAKGRLGDYVFYLDFAGHREQANIKAAICELEKMAFVKILGSYERKY